MARGATSDNVHGKVSMVVETGEDVVVATVEEDGGADVDGGGDVDGWTEADVVLTPLNVPKGMLDAGCVL